MSRLWMLLLVGCSCFSIIAGATRSALAEEPLELGSRRELFVDQYLIGQLEGDIRLQLNPPRDEGPVLKFDEPWEGNFCGYATVIYDGEKYRLYYRGLRDAGNDGADAEKTCYAESQDGIHWVKPKLGLYEYKGSKENNIILAHAAPATHNFCPFLDRRPGVPAEERFKAVGGTNRSGLLGFISADGVHWRKLPMQPVYNDEGWVFDSQNVVFWSTTEKQYVLYYRRAPEGVRAIARATSPDFLHWSKPVQMRYSDTNTTKPSHHLYTNQTQQYFRAPHIYLATAARFMPGRQVLTDAEAKAINVHPKYFRDTSDAVLMSSRGGDLYDRTFLSALIRPGIGAENWVSRTNYPALNIVPTGAHEMSLYANQNYGQETSHLRRYSSRFDGLSSLHAEYAGGELITPPLTFTGEKLELNFSTSAAGGLRVEIQDAAGKPLPGFSLADARELIGNEIARNVSWKSNPELGKLAGRPVRLRFVLRDADLFSLRFHSPTPEK